MYVVAVLDNGEQRTFLSEELKILDRVVYATICGKQKQFVLADVVDIVPIDEGPKRPKAFQPPRRVQ
jgi:hypothetical protein